MGDLEARIAALEKTVQENHWIAVMLFELLFHVDKAMKPIFAEELRKILANSPIPLSPAEVAYIRSLRDRLLTPSNPEMVETMNRPPVRPVD